MTVERRLPYALRSGDLDSQEAITARCRSAAAAVVALDPALSDRLAAMRAVLSLLRDAGPPHGSASLPDPQRR